jgi:integrase/recombinase XerC
MAPFFVFTEFENYLTTEKRYSEHTINAYKNDLFQFLEFYPIQSLEQLQELNYQIIRSWIVQLMDDKIANRSVNRKLSTLRSFCKWAQRNGYIEYNPMLKIVAPKTEKRIPQFIKQTEISRESLIDLFPDNFEGIRNRLIVEMFYQTGIRLSELISLIEKDVSSTSIKVLGKRNKERIIPIAPDLSRLIQEYLLAKRTLIIQSHELFSLENGKKMYPRLVYRIINNYLGIVTNSDKKSPHVLRHTFATHMLNNGAGLETLKDLLGHANLSATQVYTHSSFTQLNNIYSQAHPRGRKKN